MLIESSAVISPEGWFRYKLTRGEFDAAALMWVMLNPSTADATVDDRTIGRVRGFTAALGFKRFHVCNLYAYRSTDPDELSQVHDAVGPENDWWLEHTAQHSAMVICAWGTKALDADRPRLVRHILTRHHPVVHVLGTSKGGHPLHPLYLPAATVARPWAT